MNNYKYILTMSLTGMFLLMTVVVSAQPSWAVTPPDFQYTMTVTGVGLYYCQETIDEADMIAAFINDECRGVQHFSTTVNEKKLAYLTIYDNVPSGSEITIRMYDASEDKIIEDVYPIIFLENETLGNAAEPYEFQTDFPLSELYLENAELFDYSVKGDLVAPAIAINGNGESNTLTIDFVDDSLGIDNAYFSTAGADLILEEDVDFINKQFYQIHLIATTPAGCTIDEVFIIEVINTNVPPTGLDKSDLEINENEEIGSLVLTLIALDESVNDEHVYELVGEDIDWPDNKSFSIQSDELLSTEVFNYEEKEFYTIQVKITDRVGNMYIDTLPISILDVIEFDDLKASNLVTPNEDGFNDFLEIPNVHLFENYTLLIYNDNGNELFQVTENYDNSWNGLTSKGRELPTGTYYFLLRDNSNAANQFVGDIHLYRANKF